MLMFSFLLEIHALQDPQDQENDHHSQAFLHQENSIKNEKTKKNTKEIKQRQSLFARLYSSIWYYFSRMRLYAIQYTTLDVLIKRLTFYMPELW
jgi:hypothetical protein